MNVEEKVETIITELPGEVSLPKLLRKYNLSPSVFFKFLRDNNELKLTYELAQQARSEYLVEEIVDIADTEIDANLASVRINTRKWYASKMRPHKYGDKIEVNVTQTVDITAALSKARERIAAPIGAKLISAGQERKEGDKSELSWDDIL